MSKLIFIMSQLFTLPRMGFYTDIFRDMLEKLGCEVLLPPPITQKTIKLGVRNSSDMMCFPYKVTLGCFIEALDAGADSLIMYENSYGTCRYRHYHTIQKQTLEDMGYKFRMYPLTSRNPIKSIRAIAQNANYLKIFSVLIQTYKDMKKVEKSQFEYRKNNDISMGIIGEIYTMLEPAINYDIIRKLRNLGVDVHLSVSLSDFMKKALNRLRPKSKLEKEAGLYLKHPIGGHGMESIENTLYYARNKFDGIIHLLPLSCMPETTVEPIINILSKRHDIPVYRFPIDENRFESGFDTRIETFVSLLKRKKEAQKQRRSESRCTI